MGASSRFSIEGIISMIDHVTKPMANANKSVSMFSGNAKRHFGGLGNLISSSMGMLGVAGGGAAIYMGMKKIIGEAMNLEGAVANFKTLLGGSNAEAQKLVNRLQVMGASTPFEFKDLTKMTQILLPTMKGDIDNVIKTLTFLGDTAGGNAQKLETITRGYNKAMLKGKVDMESLNMIAEAGVPIHAELAKSMGFGENQMTAFFKKISTGTVGTEELTKAFIRMTSDGGLFFNGMLNSAKTTSGLWSTFKDAISMTAGAIGQELLPTIREIIISLTEIATKMLIWVQNNKQFIADTVQSVKSFLGILWSLRYVILAIAAAWGVYRIAVLASMVATRSLIAVSAGLKVFNAIKILGFADGLKYLSLGSKGATAAIGVLSKAQLFLNGAMIANPVGLIIAGITALVAIVVVAIRNWNTWGSVLLLFTGIFAPIISSVMAVKTHWAGIVGAFQNNGILAGLKAIGMMLLDVVLYPLQKILELVQKIPGIGKYAGKAVGAIQQFRESAPEAKIEKAIGAQTKIPELARPYNDYSYQKPEKNMQTESEQAQPKMFRSYNNYASPNSSAIASGTRTEGNIDINVYAPKNAASISQGGQMPRGTKLNKGEQ